MLVDLSTYCLGLKLIFDSNFSILILLEFFCNVQPNEGVKN